MLGFLKEKLAGGAKRMTGKTDMLEAACAMCALVGGADGDFSEDEATVALDRLMNHDVLSASFPPTQIEQRSIMPEAPKQVCPGKISPKREPGVPAPRAKANGDDWRCWPCIAIDVAMADGSVGDKEMKALKDIGTALGGFDLPAKYPQKNKTVPLAIGMAALARWRGLCWCWILPARLPSDIAPLKSASDRAQGGRWQDRSPEQHLPRPSTPRRSSPCSPKPRRCHAACHRSHATGDRLGLDPMTKAGRMVAVMRAERLLALTLLMAHRQ